MKEADCSDEHTKNYHQNLQFSQLCGALAEFSAKTGLFWFAVNTCHLQLKKAAKKTPKAFKSHCKLPMSTHQTYIDQVATNTTPN